MIPWKRAYESMLSLLFFFFCFKHILMGNMDQNGLGHLHID